jgi:hypothetical protein
LVEFREPLLDFSREPQSFGDQAEMKRLVKVRSGGGCRSNTASHPINAIGALSPTSRRPAQEHVAVCAIQREAVFPRDPRVLVHQPLDPADIAREDREGSDTQEGKGERVGMAEVTGMEQRSIAGPRRLIGIAVMPVRLGQIAQRAGADVLAVAEGEFAVLLRPIERGCELQVGSGLAEFAGHQLPGPKKPVAD